MSTLSSGGSGSDSGGNQESVGSGSGGHGGGGGGNGGGNGASSSEAMPTASALAIPTPSHMPGGLSPMGKHARGAFDSTPSFSSPLAYASTLPTEQADELDLDSPLTAGEDGREEVEEESEPSRPVYLASSPLSSYRPIQPNNEEDGAHDLLDVPTTPTSSSSRRERTNSARARLLAWDKHDVALPPRAPTGPSVTSASRGGEGGGTASPNQSRRKSHAPTTLMGPPLMIPRKTSGSTASGTSATSTVSGSSSGGKQEQATWTSRAPSGASDDSSSADGSVSPSLSWQPASNMEARRASAATPANDKGTPARRIRSSTQGSVASAHRRAKSLGGALLGEAASPIGGPDGVDPDLVAAIRAGDSSIPGTSIGLEASLSRLSLGPEGQTGGTASVSPSSRIASLPSTPSGTIRTLSSSRKPSDQLSVIPDTRALASSYPTLQVPRREAEPVPSSPKATRPSPDYVRSRVRSQTMSPGNIDAGGQSLSSAGSPSASFGPSSGSQSRANAPLGEAIRLQRMPTSIRMAGDFYNRNEPSNRLHPAPPPSSSSSGNSTFPGHGLGIGGMSDAKLPALPQTPSVTRSVSPMLLSELATSSSASSSGRSSPVAQRQPTFGATAFNDPSPLSVQIPAFRQQEVSLAPLSAMPALHYHSSQSPASKSSTGPGLFTSGHSSAFAPLLAMPSAHQQQRDGQRASARPMDTDVPDLGAQFDPTLRPAPWIASSQEGGNKGNKTTLKSALTQRGRASISTASGSGHFHPVRANSGKVKEGRRISVAPSPQGIDEYARIIVQSRNAKMQKWRTMSKQQRSESGEGQTRRPVPEAGEQSQALAGGSSTFLQPLDQSRRRGSELLELTSSMGRLPSDNAATPNVSPAASDLAFDRVYKGEMGDDVGNREIEWVDWLDEYRRMKEAKLRSERGRLESEKRQEEEAEVESELSTLPSRMDNQRVSPLTASATFSSSPTSNRLLEPTAGSGLSQSTSASLGLSDSRWGRPRRPSEMPRFTGRQGNPSEIRRSTSNALLPTSVPYYDDGQSSSTLGRRSSLFQDKSRTLSLSPITTRIASTGSQQSSSSYAGGKKKKMLGGKIEAWWGAVKSGFGGSPTTASNVNPATTPSPSFAHPHQASGRMTSESVEEEQEGSGDLHRLFTSHTFATPHGRSNTLHANNPRQPTEAKSVHTLRAASSAQNLRPEEGGEVMPHSDGPSVRSDRSSTGTAHAAPLISSSAASEDTTGAGGGEAAKATLSRTARRGTHLSLNLDNGLSAFDASPFEKLVNSSSSRQTTTTPSSKAASSPRKTAEEALHSATSSGGPKTLSDAWKPELNRGAIDAATNVSLRGRSKQRSRESPLEGRADSTSKDITINSIRKHIHNRLAASKESCDKELKKIILSINAFVEETIQEQQREEELETSGQGGADEEDRQDGVFDQDTDLDSPLGLLSLNDADPMQAANAPAPSNSRNEDHGHQSQDEQTDGIDPDETPQPNSDEGLQAPTPRRARDFTSAHPSNSTLSASRDYVLPTPPLRGGPSSAGMVPMRSLSRSTLSRNRSRDVLSTSRSTSRSHSPMPTALLSTSLSADSPQYSPARRIRPLPAEDVPLEPYIAALQDLVSIAMDVFDTSINTLTAKSGTCSEIIANVQSIGRLWDENPRWLGRGWYVQLLLAVAGLSRVVEWWEAEKGFWNFQDDQEQGDKNETEPIRFIFGSTAAILADGSEFVDYQSAPSARSVVGNSPSRIRPIGRSQVMGTPSQQSSATSSPALEPWDRRVVSESDRGKRAQEQSRAPSEAGGPTASVDVAVAALPKQDDGGVKESQNILMELSLDGERFLYLSPTWSKIVGSDPTEMFDVPIRDILAPGDAMTFAQATQQLEANDSHTVEVAFRVQVHPTEGEEADMTYYQEMEGKGMLMHDRQSALPSHTMWVFKPIGSPEPEGELAPGPQKPTAGAGDPPVVGDGSGATSDQILISTEPLLCRICERDVPTWFFEKHSEICNEIHRLEMEISEYNEALAELRRATKSVLDGLDEAERIEPVEYRSLPLSTPPASLGPPSALEVANRSISPRHPNPAALRKMHIRALDSLLDVLRLAGTISTPAVKDDTASDPIEKQRLLSPQSEDKIVQVKNWKRVACDDPALDLLASDVETAMRSKLSAVNRMLNTIVYVETVRMEWEGRVEAALATVREGSLSTSEEEEEAASAEEQEAAVARAAPPHEVKEEEEEEGSAAAVLLESYEPDSVPRPGSSALSVTGAREEDIPGVEGHMGGSAMDVFPIPIPSRPSPSSNAAAPRRRMTRDASSTSSLGVESAFSPGTGLRLDTSNFTSHSRRESLLSSERGGGSGGASSNQTPPLSPRLHPGEASFSRAKDRRSSVTHRTSIHSPHLAGVTPLSPRLPPTAPSSRPTASSIKDFDIIKPISKGAFGSVFLAKKRTTGDYYAIKVLKKSDMIAKNQITNVKAERMILMTQTQSPFVVKLLFTFQSTEYLYLVMEYLPGGDCASLCKALGGLPEEWAKQYVAEVVNGLEMLHGKGVVHRDMKPDNLLIDQKGHLKLTDFGLSKIGLLGRQNRQQLSTLTTKSTTATPRDGHAKKDSSGSTGSSNPSVSPLHVKSPTSSGGQKVPETPLSTSIVQSQTFFVGLPSQSRSRIVSASTDASDSSGSESPLVTGNSSSKPVPVPSSSTALDSPSHIFGPHMLAESLSSSAAVQTSGGSGPQLKKFVGTPDYLAPESILGLGMDDAAVDWWALGVILYEFLYGYPPFHADTPEKVFDNILSRKIDWEEDEEIQISAPARDLMERLMCSDRKHRLGAGEHGAADIKAHPFLAGIDWDNLTKVEGPFVPQITDAESTDYFDLRGAVYQEFGQEQPDQQPGGPNKAAIMTAPGFNREFAKALEGKRALEPSRPPSRFRTRMDRNKNLDHSQGGTDEFGSFSYKNLPVLKQANDDVIKKMRGDQLNSMSSAMMDQGSHSRHRSISAKATTPGHRNSTILLSHGGPPSPSTSVSSQSSAPSKSTAPTSPSGGPFLGGAAHHLPSLHHLANPQPSLHRRRPSELCNTSGSLAAGASPAGGSNMGGSPAGGSTTGGSPAGGSTTGGASMMERKRAQLNESETGSRRSSLPTRLRTSSLTGASDQPPMPWSSQQHQGQPPPSSTDSPIGETLSIEATEDSMPLSAGSGTTSNAEIITCLIAEDNPISLKMLENVLVKLGCVVSSVRNGAEALRLAMAERKFAVLFIDVTLPIVNGQDVARMIKSTRNINSVTPIIALASVDIGSLDVTGSVFDAVLAKPIEKTDVCNILPRFGFKPLIVTSRAGGGMSVGGGARRATVAGLERIGSGEEEKGREN